MPKLKTRKSVAKRVKVTKSKKYLIRKGGQDHFNARENEKTRKNKRRDRPISKSHDKAIKYFLPYH